MRKLILQMGVTLDGFVARDGDLTASLALATGPAVQAYERRAAH